MFWNLKSRIPLNRSPTAKNARDLNHLLAIRLADLEAMAAAGKIGSPVRPLAQMGEEERRAIVGQLEAREAARSSARRSAAPVRRSR